MANPPPPTDSFDNLFNIGENDSVDISSLNVRKRGWEENDTVRSPIPTQRCRSNKNTGVGSGFNNRPEDPINLVDKDDDDVDVEVKGKVF